MFWAGFGVVFLCVFGGYVLMGGNIMIILKAAPMEFVIIGGAAAGAFLIANPKSIIAATGTAFKDMLKGPPFTKDDYLQVLSLHYMIFKLAKSKGMLAVESHIENPEDSTLFNHFPTVQKNHHVVEFICDYLRMMTMGTDNVHQMEDLMNEELEGHHHERSQMAAVFTNMGDGLPALGIVAAVLGVIKTMAAIDQPPAILGKMIGGALVGTFLGVLLAYGWVGPIGQSLTHIYAEESKYYHCIKTALLAYLQGHPPSVALEFARKTIPTHLRPSFSDLEQALAALPNPSANG